MNTKPLRNHFERLNQIQREIITATKEIAAAETEQGKLASADELTPEVMEQISGVTLRIAVLTHRRKSLQRQFKGSNAIVCGEICKIRGDLSAAVMKRLASLEEKLTERLLPFFDTVAEAAEAAAQLRGREIPAFRRFIKLYPYGDEFQRPQTCDLMEAANSVLEQVERAEVVLKS